MFVRSLQETDSDTEAEPTTVKPQKKSRWSIFKFWKVCFMERVTVIKHLLITMKWEKLRAMKHMAMSCLLVSFYREKGRLLLKQQWNLIKRVTSEGNFHLLTLKQNSFGILLVADLILNILLYIFAG